MKFENNFEQIDMEKENRKKSNAYNNKFNVGRIGVNVFDLYI